jgi:hypothetical protein
MKKNIIHNLVKLIIVSACFSFLYYNLDIDIIKKIFNNLNYNFITPLILVFILYLVTYSIFTFKIYDYLFKSKLELINWMKIYVNGNFFNSIPLFGFIYKGYRLNKYGISIKKYFFANIFISWFAVSVFFLIYSLEIIFLVNPVISIFNIPVYLFLLSISILTFFGPKIGNFFLQKLNINIQIIKSLFVFLEKNRLSKKMVKHYLTYGLLLHALIFCTYFFVIKLLNIPISFKIIIVIFLINEIVDAIPIPNNNFFLTELIGGFTATFVGVAFTEFVLIKFVFRIINLIIIIPIFIIINTLLKSEL